MALRCPLMQVKIRLISLFRYITPHMKWEVTGATGGGMGGGRHSNKKKNGALCSPGSDASAPGGGVGNRSDINGDPIPDETLQQLTVKELNKKVQNLARDEVVALKQRRRTLKNRG